MKTFSLSLLMALLFLAGHCQGQTISGERLSLSGSFPYIEMARTGEAEHYIDCLSDQMAFIVTSGSEGYKFRIFENAKPDALIVNQSGITIGDDGSGVAMQIKHSDTNQTFGVTSLSSNFGLHNGGIGFSTPTASFPFYVFNTTRSETLTTRLEGVGIGTYEADSALHVFADGFPFSEAKVLVENNLATTASREMLSLVNNGSAQFTFTDTNLGKKWLFGTNASGGFIVSLVGTAGNEFAVQPTGRVIMGPGGRRNFDLAANGNLFIAGTLTQSSDRNLKTAFAQVDECDVLERLAKMPIQTWQFKTDDSGIRHIGPTAQDFYAQFRLGADDTTIAPVDGIGVALASIQALHQRAETQTQQIDELKKQLEEQRDLVSRQAELLEALTSRMESLESELNQATGHNANQN